MADGIILQEDHEIKGHWWVPSNTGRLVAGTLYLSAHEAIYLALEGTFRDESGLMESSGEPIVLGMTHRGEKVTLSQCSPAQMALGGLASMRYRCDVAYIGHHFEDEDEMEFEAAYISLNHLDGWVNESGFKISSNNYPDVTIEYSLPESIRLYRDSDFRVEISFSLAGPSLDLVQKSVSIIQSTHLVITRYTNRSMDEYLATCAAIQSFIALAVRGSTHPTRLQFIHQGIGERREINVFFALDYRRDMKLKLPPEMVFTFPRVRERVGQVLIVGVK